MEIKTSGRRRWIEDLHACYLQTMEFHDWVTVATLYFRYGAWMVRWEHPPRYGEDFLMALDFQDAQKEIEDQWTQELIANVRHAKELLDMWSEK